MTQWCLAHPLLTTLLGLASLHTLSIVVNRTFRHWNIRKHGYPPAHCDADGNFPPNGSEKHTD